ncbi:cilia- and flagella-associated protein 410-like isoform X2 [Belonocnema kinseyi]|uniref:cilia- and flagella-associated protein 410-like isoform X2 n=1 Tax=Belonocnema kinseyi TaxID=2817044 RepID=UPI00143D830E|nr:cilia- and flagella-associated protein 410-like isoform X2 [Belonocnema kinseyi]
MSNNLIVGKYCFRFRGTELTDVSILQRMKNVEVLSLSVNGIDTLAPFQYCMNLRDLFVRKNNIQDLNEVCFLQDLPNLRNLWLNENPCAEREGYRLSVLRVLPNLQKLDDKIVSEEEVQIALSRGKILIHPLDFEASSPQPDPNLEFQEELTEYLEEPELVQRRRYSSSSDQRSYDEPLEHHEDHVTDKRNANYDPSPSPHYAPNNHYGYEYSNILSAVLSLVKELDYPSLQVVEVAIRNRKDDLMEE